MAFAAALTLAGWAFTPVADAQETGVPRDRVEPDPTAPSVVQPELLLQQSAPSGPPAGADSTLLQLTDVVIEGATVLDPQRLRSFYEADLGQTVPLTRLFEITAAIETAYRTEGYILTKAVVPAQTVENGVFRIRVIEGFIDSVVIEGDLGPVQALVEQYARRLAGQRPARIDEIERYLLLINDIPGVSARGIPRPGVGAVGATELVIVTERKWYEGFAFMDNRGSRFLGPLNGALGAALNSFTQFGEQLQAVVFGNIAADREQTGAQLSYSQFLGSDGFRIGGFVTYGEATPGDSLEPLDVESETLLLNLEAEYPAIRSRALSLWLNGGFDYIDGETDVIRQPFSEDKLRVLYAGGRLEMRDDWLGASALQFRIRHGLDIFGATDKGDPDTSRLEGDGQFTTVWAEASRLQRLTRDLSAFLRVGGQYSFDELLAGEEFALGGLTFGRGYDPSELTGEHGLGLSAELRYALPQTGYADRVELYAFYDYGKIWNTDSGSTLDDADLSSAGAGVRADVRDWLSAALEVAKPLTRDLQNRGGRSERVFFSMTARF